MTERNHSLPPHIATPTQSAFNAAARALSKDAPIVADPVEEEPYTIKCICDYSDDDGNTIYCETCDTWQHIECFYHGNVEEASRDDFSHFCADCKPRILDRRKATERQRQQRQDRPSLDMGEKKTKRPLSKSHRKKPRPSDLQVNGYNHDQEVGQGTKAGSPLDSHGRKSKSNHRSHHSISSQAAKRSPPHQRNAQNHSHGHPISPATTPPDLPEDFVIHSYSKQLQDLYDNDPGAQNILANSFASLAVTSAMSLWLCDPEKLRIDAGVEDSRDAFQKVQPGVDFAAQFTKTKLQVKSKEVIANDITLRLRYLTVVEPLRKYPDLVGELKGLVGFQRDYCKEDCDRFTKLCHPAPFVFFHPRLPLYIDTRREGSQCRYIRRSCRANTTLDTYITNQSEYHFCIVNERALAPGEQVTLPWDFRFPAGIKARYLYFLGLSDEDGAMEPEVSELEYSELSDFIDNVLSDYGGCACDLGHDCAFVRFHRNYHARAHAQANGVRSKKGRKPKQHVSPTSTGHATNSRDASEGQAEPYDGEDDSRSTSGSIQGKPRSRDMTPFGYGSTENHRNSNDHVSEREKRKLMDIEKTFERMDQAQPPRKKKRTSDGPAPSTTNARIGQKPTQKSSRASVSNASVIQMNGTVPRTYKDASTSRQQSYSPHNAISPTAATPVSSRPVSRQLSVVTRSNYKDASVQTDDVEDCWYSKPRNPLQKKTFVPLSKRLLLSQRKLRLKAEARLPHRDAYLMNGVEAQSASNASSPELHNHNSVKRPGSAHAMEVTERPRSSGSSAPSVDSISVVTDTPMPDAPSNTTPVKLPPQWGTVRAAPLSNTPSPVESRSPNLHMQMPPNPLLADGSQTVPATVNGLSTPSQPTGHISQSPFNTGIFSPAFSPSVLSSVGQHPSPVKKKLSLKDYKARLASASKTTPSADSETIPKPSLSINEDSKMIGVLEGSAIMESPVMERKDNPLAVAGELDDKT